MDAKNKGERDTIIDTLDSIAVSLRLTPLGKNDNSPAYDKIFRKRVRLTMKRVSLLRKLDQYE